MADRNMPPALQPDPRPPREEWCDECDGTGWDWDQDELCLECNGTGKVST